MPVKKKNILRGTAPLATGLFVRICVGCCLCIWFLSIFNSKLFQANLHFQLPGETYEKMVLPVLSPDPNTDATWPGIKVYWRCRRRLCTLFFLANLCSICITDDIIRALVSRDNHRGRKRFQLGHFTPGRTQNAPQLVIRLTQCTIWCYMTHDTSIDCSGGFLFLDWVFHS